MKCFKKDGKTRVKGWNTSDADEREVRRQRAHDEKMAVRAVPKSGSRPFCSYEVAHETPDRHKVVYHVEIRALDAARNTCDCPDFVKSGLGTCKHIERVLASLRVPRTSPRESAVCEVFMGREPYAPVLTAGKTADESLLVSLKRHFTPSGGMRDATAAGFDALLQTCEKMNARSPGVVRVSAEVVCRRDELARREELARRTTSFAQVQGTDGHWPFLKQTLYPYQREGALHLAGKGRALLADEMGLGKTVQAIAAALLMRETVGVARTLVVVPASLKGEWEEQIAFFSDAPFESIYGARQERLARYRHAKSFFVIANYEQVIRDWREINEILKPDIVILDEAQRIKNWKTKTAQNLKRLVSPYAFVLTGTPLENRIDEFYSLAEFVDPRLFGSLFRFNRAYLQFDEDGKTVGLQNLSHLHEKAATILLRRRKSAVEDDLPGRKTKTYFTGMTPEQSRRYADYWQVVAALYQTSQRRPLSPAEQDRLQKALSCMRMLCDTCYILDRKIRESPKADEFENVLRDILDADPDRKVIVFSEWVRMLELVAERLDDRNIGYATHTGLIDQRRRREEIRRFKTDPKCRVFLASESGGVGLNLQVASVVVNLDLPWNPAKLEQRIARAWRKNQTRDVLVVNLVAEGTIEQKMLGTLRYKQGLSDFVLDAIGDAKDFEKRRDVDEGDGRKKRNAFMERLASVMGEAVHVEERKSAFAAEPTIPPHERLRAAVETEVPGVNLLLTVCDEVDDAKSIKGVVAVGTAVDRGTLVRQIAETHGVALPEESVKVVSREQWELLQRLERMGVITFAREGIRRVVERPSAESDEAGQWERKRKTLQSKAFAEAKRLLKMGELLTNGGFAQEGMASCRRAIALAAGAACYSSDDAHADRPVDPVTIETLVTARSVLALAAEDALSLQLAVQGLDLPDALARAASFIELCME